MASLLAAAPSAALVCSAAAVHRSAAAAMAGVSCAQAVADSYFAANLLNAVAGIDVAVAPPIAVHAVAAAALAIKMPVGPRPEEASRWSDLRPARRSGAINTPCRPAAHRWSAYKKYDNSRALAHALKVISRELGSLAGWVGTCRVHSATRYDTLTHYHATNLCGRPAVHRVDHLLRIC